MSEQKVHNAEWLDREQARAEAVLLLAATEGHGVAYGDLHRYARLRWYRDGVLVPISRRHLGRGWPDLTGLLHVAGQESRWPEDAAASIAFWQAHIATDQAAEQ